MDYKLTYNFLLKDLGEFYSHEIYRFGGYDGPKLKYNEKYFSELLKFAYDNLREVDKIIEHYLNDNWTIERLDISSLSILRAGITEIKYFPEVPRKVLLNEYTDLTVQFFSLKEIGFINSLLNNFVNNTTISSE